MDVKWILIGSHEDVQWISSNCQVDVEWMSSGCRVDVKWMLSGCQVDVELMSSGCQVDVKWIAIQFSRFCNLDLIQWISIGLSLAQSKHSGSLKNYSWKKKCLKSRPVIGWEPGIEDSYWSRASSENFQRGYPYNRESVPINEFWADSFRWRMSYLHRAKWSSSGFSVHVKWMSSGK